MAISTPNYRRITCGHCGTNISRADHRESIGATSKHDWPIACKRSLWAAWIPVSNDYIDPGFTGGNMDRPGLKRLMADIEAGKIDIVVV